MLVKRLQGVEFAIAETTRIVFAVPSAQVGLVPRRPLPLEPLARDDVVRVPTVHKPVRRVTVKQRRLGARTRLQVVPESCRCREF